MKTSDLRGAARLAHDATAGLVDLVEAMHAGIARLPGNGDAPPQRTRGITGLVYGTVRGVTRLVGGSVDALLGLLTPALAGTTDAPRNADREAVVAALNGVLGDHLAATHNPLATTMALHMNGRALPLQADPLRQRLQDEAPASDGLLLLIHGLCMNDLQWQRAGHSHGAALAQQLGLAPVYLHYNSGLAIADNGAQLAALLPLLLAAWPRPLQRTVLLTHSMGGLIARSAIAQGTQWPSRIDDLVFLGTPHHGAPLERAGHGVELLLAAAPYARPLARLARVRSAGITDLRHGRVLAGKGVPVPVVPLPTATRCFAIAGSSGPPGGVKGRLIGDGLVPVASALGQHDDPARALAFAPQRQWVAHGVNHMQLLGDAAVFEQLLCWLQAAGVDNRA